MKNKKLLFIIIFNFLLVLLLYKVIVYQIKNDSFYDPYPTFLYHTSQFDNNISTSNYNTEPFPPYFKRLELTDENLEKFCGENRKVFNSSYTKRPIIVTGCSYAYGHGIKKDETFPYILSQITQSPVYNYANCGAQAYENLSENSRGCPLRNPDFIAVSVFRIRRYAAVGFTERRTGRERNGRGRNADHYLESLGFFRLVTGD